MYKINVDLDRSRRVGEKRHARKVMLQVRMKCHRNKVACWVLKKLGFHK